MSSDSDDGPLYSRSTKLHREFTAKMVASTKAIGELVPHSNPPVMGVPGKAVAVEDVSILSSSSESGADSALKLKKKKKPVEVVRKKIVGGRKKNVGRKNRGVSESDSDREEAKANRKVETAHQEIDSSSCDEDYRRKEEEAKYREVTPPLYETSPLPEIITPEVPTRGIKRGRGAQRGGRRGRGRGGKQQKIELPSGPKATDFSSYSQAAQRLEESCSKAMLSLAKTQILQDNMDVHNLSTGSFGLEEDSRIIVKVRWNLEVVKLELFKNQKFLDVFSYFASLSGVTVKRILLTLRDKSVSHNDTPESLCFNPIIDIFVVGVINETSDSKAVEMPPEPTANPNEIEIKVQSSDRKKTHTLKVMKDDPMSVLMQKYSEMTGQPLSKLKFKFDGEMLDSGSTPVDLDLEGGECIDVHLS